MYITRGQLLAPLDTSRQLDSSTVSTVSTALDTTERCTTLDSLDSLDSAVKLSSSTVPRQLSTVVDSCRQLSTVVDSLDSLDSQGSAFKFLLAQGRRCVSSRCGAYAKCLVKQIKVRRKFSSAYEALTICPTI